EPLPLHPQSQMLPLILVADLGEDLNEYCQQEQADSQEGPARIENDGPCPLVGHEDGGTADSVCEKPLSQGTPSVDAELMHVSAVEKLVLSFELAMVPEVLGSR
ncbi:MAG: hypothetical protein KAX78_01220, partial [Phycisphaerae bacterium]|nr:hypothetical protein [Phycisphaerae bacterium]